MSGVLARHREVGLRPEGRRGCVQRHDAHRQRQARLRRFRPLAHRGPGLARTSSR